jgi:hypothetical protein
MGKDQIFPEIIKNQEEVIREYRSLREETSLQNISYFLDSFIREHQALADGIRKGTDHVSMNIPDSRHMEVTRHIREPEVLDKNSLQGVLLHICKVEENVLARFEELCRSGDCSSLKSFVEWQEHIHEEADNLYHRFVEISAS